MPRAPLPGRRAVDNPGQEYPGRGKPRYISFALELDQVDQSLSLHCIILFTGIIANVLTGLFQFVDITDPPFAPSLQSKSSGPAHSSKPCQKLSSAAQPRDARKRTWYQHYRQARSTAY